MPAVRLNNRRRRSSLAVSAFNPIKAGKYGIQSPSPRVVTFAPNVTPGTYVEPEMPSPDSSEPGSPSARLFPPSVLPAPAPSRRRVPPGKRRSMGYIPRPPNAFMLFRADFVRQKHVPGSIETNHGSLSKIIGNCWRSLPLDEKRVWEVKAKHAKAEHKQIYPEYRFRPVHNKNKEKKEKAAATPDDERRCEEVAQLLLEGKKGDELAAAVRSLDRLRTDSPVEVASGPMYPHRRSSSVPLPDYYRGYKGNGIALPELPFLSLSRGGSPPPPMPVMMNNDMRMMYGQRRASSVPSGGWMLPPSSLNTAFVRDDSPLPEVNTDLFESSYLGGASSFGAPPTESFSFDEFLNNLPAKGPNDIGMSPLENVPPHELLYHGPNAGVPFSQLHPQPELDPLTWIPIDSTHSDPSSTYSGSPAPSESSLPAQQQHLVHAPKPQHASAPFEMWDSGYNASDAARQQQQQQQQHQGYQQHQPEFTQSFDHCGDMGIGMDYSQTQQQSCGPEVSMQGYASGLDTLFEPSYVGSDVTGQNYQFNDMVHEYH